MNNNILNIIESAKKEHSKKDILFLDKYLKYRQLPIQENVILYESFFGAGLICNPYALFKEFLEREDFFMYEHVWVINNYENNSFNFIKYFDYPNVKFVLYNSEEYLKYLSIAKYLINNCTFQPFFNKKKNQIYINTWHGTPNKKLGFDVPQSNLDMGNTIRNFLSADYLISYNSFMTQVYRESYKLDSIYEGKILEVGAPRNDTLFKPEEVKEKLEKIGINIDPSKKIILYAPTWRKSIDFNKDIKKIIETLSIPGYQVLVKLHHVDYKKENCFIPESIDMNELLNITDVLITDYSSVWYDWALKKKPVLFYTPDREEYEKKQGLYWGFPYQTANNLITLSIQLKNLSDISKTISKHLDKVNRQFNYLEGRKTSKTILDYILDGKAEVSIKSFKTQKKKLLFYAGDFKPNGVTTSFNSLLKMIDYDKYDVSLIVLKKQNPEYVKAINSLPKSCRVLCRAGTYARTLMEESANAICLNQGISTDYLKSLLPVEMYQREWNRCFGKTNFDAVINFTGYSPFYGFLFMVQNCTKVIWLHNDMKKDQLRFNAQGEQPLFSALNAVFSTYPFYDKLVSASKGVMEINKENFPNISNYKFTFVHNTLDCEKVYSLSKEKSPFKLSSKTIKFVNNARLSTAKNQEALIKAFININQKYPNTELFISGNGELKDKLLGLSKNNKNIHLLGYLENPFSLIRECDCFVFPSTYEGQGIAVLEARLLNKPIILSPLPRMNGIEIPNGQIKMEDFSQRSIERAMEIFLSEGAPSYQFDGEEYNYEACKELEELLCQL